MDVDKMVKSSKEMTLEQLLVKLRIEKSDEHDGKRTYCVKSIPKKKILRYLKSILRVIEIEKYRRKMKVMLKQKKQDETLKLPKEWNPIIGKDKIVQIYESERIMKGCIKAVHERIENDSTKFQLSELSELFFQLTRRVKEAAANYDIDVMQEQASIQAEMDVMNHLSKAYKGLDQTFTELILSDEERSPSPLLPSISGKKKNLGHKESPSRVHIGERSKSVAQNSSEYPPYLKSLTKRNLLDFQKTHNIKRLDDHADLMSLQKTLRQGLIDQDKVLNLDIDGYYNKILHK
jgi:hypothetical protein